MKSYVVIGLGLFGMELALQLYENGEHVMAIDINPELVASCADSVTKAVVADAKKREVLKNLGVDRFDCAIIAMTSDLATSVLVTMNLKALGVNEIICKAQNATDMEVLETLGATTVIIPEKIAADRLCRKICHPNVMEYIELSEKYGMIEMQVPKSWVGSSILDLGVRAKYGVNIIAIKKGKDIEVSFDANYHLESTDDLVFVGENAALAKVQKIQ